MQNKSAQTFSIEVLIVIIFLLVFALFFVTYLIGESTKSTIEVKNLAAESNADYIYNYLGSEGIIYKDNKLNPYRLLSIDPKELNLPIKGEVAIILKKGDTEYFIGPENEIVCIGTPNIQLGDVACE